MQITKDDILNCINKMVASGKQLPQMDRIRYSKNPGEERQKVILDTVNLWWDLFGKQNIGQDRWEKAVDKALVINSIPRLDTQIINTQLMSVALNKVEEEYLAEQQTKHEQEKHETIIPANFPEIGKLVAYHMKYHKQPLLSLPSADDVRAWGSRCNFKPEDVERNMIQLRVYICFCKHAERDGTKMPLKMTLDENRYLRLSIVA